MQWRMLFSTMIGYTLFYFMRKNFSFAMPGLQQDCGISKSMLGNFLFWGGIVYGLSKFVNGIVGDRVSPKKMLCLGLLACTLVNVAFGFAPRIASSQAGLVWTFGLLLVANQFFQGTGFPPCAKLIAFWIPPKELATKMSVWNTSHSIGGGLVAKICGVIMGLGAIGAANQGVGMWRWCFWSMAILGFLCLAAMVFWLPGTPKDEGLPDLPGTEQEDCCRCGNVAKSNVANGQSAGRGGMWKMVFLNPVIWMLGLINFTINAVRALVADWGPTMLQEAKGLAPTDTGTVIMLFEFAGIAGMLFAGWATDRFFGGKAPRLCVFLMALTAALFAAFWFLPAGAVPRRVLPVRAAGPYRRDRHEHGYEAVRRHRHRVRIALLLRGRFRRGQGLRQPRPVFRRMVPSASGDSGDGGGRRAPLRVPLDRPRRRLRGDVRPGAVAERGLCLMGRFKRSCDLAAATLSLAVFFGLCNGAQGGPAKDAEARSATALGVGQKGLLIQVRQAKLGRTNSGRSYIVKKSTYD